jgi:hypothetical protein
MENAFTVDETYSVDELCSTGFRVVLTAGKKLSET